MYVDIVLKATNQKWNYEMFDKRFPNEVHCFVYQEAYYYIVHKFSVACGDVLFCLISNHIILTKEKVACNAYVLIDGKA